LVEVWLPYGRSEIPARVPEERLIDILKPENTKALAEPVAEVTRALHSSEQFLEKANKASRVCIVLGSCGTEQLTLDLIRALLGCLNNPQSSTVILSTGESVEPDINSVDGTRLLKHTTKSETTEHKATKGGFIPQIDSEFVKADLRILIGELRPHPFLKFAGLSDLVFPGLASGSSAFAQVSERSGLAVNDIHTERVEVAKGFEHLFALGVTLNPELRPTSVAFDQIEGCLRTLEPIVMDTFSKQITKRSDIVVMSAGGAPFDATLDRAVEALPAALDAWKKDGTLIVAAECGEGHGGGQFYEWSAEHKEPRYLESRLRHRFSYAGFKAAFLVRLLQTHRIYLVSTIPDHYVETVFSMRPASTVNAALQTAQRTHGSDSSVSVIPSASRLIPIHAETGK
jgi:lactate racemase